MTPMIAVAEYTSLKDDVPASFKVEQIWAKDRTRTTMAVRVSTQAIWLTRMPGDERERYMWLEFSLPGSNQRIRALGEVAPPPDGAQVRWTCVRWKHLFPDHQVLLERYVSAHRPRLAA
jgi:hypothetical protein